MSATYEDRELPRQKQQDDTAPRLALKDRAASGGLLDGAWWPRSRDLARELPGLIETLDPMWGRITRIAVNPAHWDAVPRHVAGRGHVVKVGWFTQELDAHKVLLLSYSVGRWDLLVVPPGTGTAAAERLMAAAADADAAPLTASALIAAEEARHGAGAPEAGTERPPARGDSTAVPVAPVREESTPVPEEEAVAVAVPRIDPGPPAPLVAGT